MSVVNVREARTQLSRLLTRAEAGEEVVIARKGIPIARLVRHENGPGIRRFGAMKGKFVVDEVSSDFDGVIASDLIPPWVNVCWINKTGFQEPGRAALPRAAD